MNKTSFRVINTFCSIDSLAGVGEIQSSCSGSGYHDEFRHLNTFSDSLSKQ